jgi:nitrate reductase gamma subunit
MRSTTQLQAGLCGITGGFLWAITPLRTPIFNAGETPEEGELVFRAYNGVLIVIAVLLTFALLCIRESHRGPSRLFTAGWWTILSGHALVLAGSLPAVLFGDQVRSLVMGGLNLGFVGAVIAALGALLLGVSRLRQRTTPTAASWLFLLTLPVGLFATVPLSATGISEDYLGLPTTILYGGAWMVLGWSWIRNDLESPATTTASAPHSQ